MAYQTSAATRRRIKETVFGSIAPGNVVQRSGRATYWIGGWRVHARYCAPGAGHYKFNLNPNTLCAEFELWICGSASHWYLIPIEVIREIYDHPAAYPDNRHADIRVVTVDTQLHRAGYAAPSVVLDLDPDFKSTLPKS